MRLKLPSSLLYPITITELLKQPSDDVNKTEPLLLYFYKTVVTEIDRDGVEHKVEKSFPARFESSVGGKLTDWLIKVGTIITKPGVEIVDISEPCSHDVQFGGLCTLCGTDMTELSYASASADANRAKINMVHDNVALRVSEDEAARAEEESKRRLVASKKLTLVVDLDQTIIHATVDPTVAEWQKDPENPNYEAIKDVRAFRLSDDNGVGKGTWYYIKLRPGLREFLENISKLYELHIYTMGTRAYAQNVADLVDPERKIFGDRILSRDESGSMVAKNLQRLFPIDQKMVVIIDDRADVWTWSQNLVKVTQYSFFVGIGDINSSFLPKRPKIRTSSTEPDQNSKKVDGNDASEVAPKADESLINAQTNGTTTESLSALEQLVSMGGGDDPIILQAQAAQQDETLAAQLQERPLLQKQKELEAEEDGESDSEKPRHHLLNDDDNELIYLEHSLRKVHTEFFDAYTRQRATVQGGRLAELRGTQKKSNPSPNLDIEMLPDIATVMPALKSKVLAGVTIVFSGVIPLDTDTQRAEISLWAKSFGAKIVDTVSRKKTTHVVAARPRTAKIRQAVHRGKGRIKIVSVQWLMDCIVQWKKLDETPYLMKTDDDNVGKPFPGEDDDILSESEEIGSPPDTDGDNTESDGEKLLSVPRLAIKTGGGLTDDEDMDGLILDWEDDKSPVGGTNKDWADMHDELEEFLGSDADDSDADSTASGGSTSSKTLSLRSPKKAKRSHAEMVEDDEDGDSGDSPSRKRTSKGPTSLSITQTNAPGLPTPAITAEDEADREDGDDDTGSDGGWSEFEGDLDAEMAKVENDEANGEG